MNKYQFILLDWDGNIAKTLDAWLIATHYPLTKRGINVSDQVIVQQCFGRPAEGYAELGVKDIDQAILEMDTAAREAMPNIELYPDALFVLEKLKQSGRKTALITTSIRTNIEHLLNKYNMRDYFDVIITNEDTNYHKPNPEPLNRALNMLKGNKDKAIMIGDSDKDIQAAANCGIDSILFYPDEHQRFYDLKELQKLNPTYEINNFLQIMNLV